jgi:putative membrane protein
MDYLLALHIIFIITWFSGMFYMPRLFIYNTEANDKPELVKNALHEQFNVMMKRLWYGITFPSAILTLIFGPLVWYVKYDFFLPEWLAIKLVFVFFLYIYFFSLHKIFKQQLNGIFKYTSQQLRIWNEIATIFLVAIVMLAVVKQGISVVWGLVGLVLFIALLMSAIKIYKMMRK